jgi:lysine-N-methylase
VAPATSPPLILTARYLTRFRCAGSACEDDCCHGWQVQVDRPHYELLERAMSGTPAARAEFEGAVTLEPAPSRTEARHGRIGLKVLVDGCPCPFLDGQKLCSVQGRYGEQVLPQTCSTYPRSIHLNGAGLEVWGTLSCPEVARQCLLPDDAMDLVPAGREISAQLEPDLGLGAERTPYQRYLDEVRGAAFRLLSLREHPMSTRLFLLAYLGKQTAPFFNKESRAVDEGRLAGVVQQVCAPQTAADWDRELRGLATAPAVSANLVSQLLVERMELAAPGLRGLVDAALASYGGEALSLPELWAAYLERRGAWIEPMGQRIDLYFENFAKNYWMREWYVSSADLLAHAQALLIRVAILRFLLFSHPALMAGPAAGLEALDRAAVEVFYKFSRGVEHDPPFVQRMTDCLVEQGAASFTHAALLALV